MSLRVEGNPLIPGLDALTDLVRAEVGAESSEALEELLSHLAPTEQKNLEAILNYVRALAALPGDQDVRGVAVSELARLDSEICRIVREHVDQELPVGDTPYFALALWVGSVRRMVPTQLFTTNYDLLLEQALERQKVPYFDGFMGSHSPTFDLQAIEEDQLPSRWTLLWKLHGSINWTQAADGTVSRRPPNAKDGSSALVYPSHLKYDQSRRLPYLAMMDRLKAFLHRPGAMLLTSGFSFRDQHINEMIEQSLRANPTASVHGLVFGALEQYEEGIAIASSVPNLQIIAEDAGVIGTVRDLWEPEFSEDGVESPTKSALGDFGQLGKLLRSLTGDLPRRGQTDE